MTLLENKSNTKRRTSNKAQDVNGYGSDLIEFLITGGARLIGSAVIHHIIQNTQNSVTITMNDFKGIFIKMVYHNFMLCFLNPIL